MNIASRSLWLDEAMLSLSFFDRDLLNLTTSSFIWNQSAPIIWLYIVKIITLIFGTSEFSLRLFSFISYIITLYLSWYILSKILKSKFALLGTCFIAGLYYLIMYSNEFKPYITDCAVTLFLIVEYYLYNQKKSSRTILNIVYISAIWMSNPACFVIGALLIVEFFSNIKEKKRLLACIITGLLVLTSFITYYFYWLKPVIDVGFMAYFWNNYKFLLTPSEIHNTGEILCFFFKGFRNIRYLIIAVFILGLFANIFIYKNQYIYVIYLAIIISLVASSLGMNPIYPRLCLWYYPFLSLIFIFFISQLAFNKYMFFLSGAVILYSLLGSTRLKYFIKSDNSYRPNEEFNIAYDYLQENISPNDTIYMFHYAYPVFMYKSNKNIKDVPPYKNNVIIGDSIFAGGGNKKEIEKLKKMDNVYILLVHAKYDDIDPLLDTLKIYGSLDTVFYKYDTPVLQYHVNKTIEIDSIQVEEQLIELNK